MKMKKITGIIIALLLMFNVFAQDELNTITTAVPFLLYFNESAKMILKDKYEEYIKKLNPDYYKVQDNYF